MRTLNVRTSPQTEFLQAIGSARATIAHAVDLADDPIMGTVLTTIKTALTMVLQMRDGRALVEYLHDAIGAAAPTPTPPGAPGAGVAPFQGPAAAPTPPGPPGVMAPPQIAAGAGAPS